MYTFAVTVHFLFEHESAEETPTSPYMDIDTLHFLFSFVETLFVYTRTYTFDYTLVKQYQVAYTHKQYDSTTHTIHKNHSIHSTNSMTVCNGFFIFQIFDMRICMRYARCLLFFLSINAVSLGKVNVCCLCQLNGDERFSLVVWENY